MTARRLYMLEWPESGLREKFIVCEWLDADYRRAVFHETPPGGSGRFFSEEDLLALEGGGEALDAWRRGDDSSVVKQEEDFEREQKVEAEAAAEADRAIEMGERLLRGRM